jgi:hypothetical protein
MMAMSPQHLFILQFDVIQAVDFDTIHATVKDLREMDLYRLPYDNTFVRIIGDPEFAGTMMTFGPLGDFCMAVITDAKTGRSANITSAPELRFSLGFSNLVLQDLLIALLATRNVEKSTRENKLKRLGIGKKADRFDFITTVALPKHLDDDEDHPPTGSAKAPHLRRGHIRRQHFGEGNQQVKKIWVAPVFVNADPGFVGGRQAYRIAA